MEKWTHVKAIKSCLFVKRFVMFVVCFVGASVLGVPVWRQSCDAVGARFQANVAASDVVGAVGGVVGRCSQPGPQFTRIESRLSKGSATVPPQVVLLQVSGIFDALIYSLGFEFQVFFKLKIWQVILTCFKFFLSKIGQTHCNYLC